MKLVSIPANPVPDNFVTGTLKTPGGVSLAICALATAGRPPRHGLHFSGPRRMDREIFRDGARFAHAGFRGRRARLARPRALRSRAQRSAQELCPRLLRIRQRSRDLHARDRFAGLSAADLRHRSFHRRDGAHPRRASRPSLVRSHGADLAVDQARRRRLFDGHRSAHRARAADGGLRHHVRAEDRHQHHRIAAFPRQYPDLGSGALCPQCRDHRSGTGALGRARRRWPGSTRRSAPCGPCASAVIPAASASRC